LYNKLKDTSLDVDKKIEIIEKDYSALGNTYEMQVQTVKHNVSWLKDFFNF